MGHRDAAVMEGANGRRLMSVVGHDPVEGDAQGLVQRRVKPGGGDINGFLLNPNRVELVAVELKGQSAQCRATLVTYLLNDRPHRVCDGDTGRRRAWQDLRYRCTEASEVERSQHSTIVPLAM